MPTVRRLLRVVVLGALTVGLVAPATAARAEPSRAEIEQQIDKFSNELEHVVENYNKITEELKATQVAIDDISAKLGPLQAKLDTAYANVGQIAAKAYKGGGLSMMAVLLSEGSTNNLVSELTSLNAIARAQQRDIEDYTRAKKDYDEQKRTLNDLHARQTTDHRNLSAHKVKIEADVAKLMDMRRRAFGNAETKVAPHTGPVPNIGGGAGAAVRFAYGAIGKPYVFGAAGPNAFDCSGLTQKAWAAAGKSLPHNAAMQWSRVAHISRGQLAPGDLVFYNGLGHVGIYVGNNQIIHASRPGVPVRLSGVEIMRPYGYGRVR